MGGTDVVVAGGGAVGLAIAWRAAQQGLAVTVADPRPGRGASYAAAGMLAPVTEVRYGEEALLALNRASSEAYPDFAAELEETSGRATGYRRCGTLLVARGPDDNAELDRLLAFQQRLGLDVERLRSRECRRLEPALAPGIRGGIHVTGDHQVDNRALLEALLEACRRSGVDVVPARVTEVVRRGQRVAGVALDDGTRREAGAVVLAAGCWTPGIDGVPPLPIRPVKGQLLQLRARGQDGPVARRNLRGLDVYLVPRPDGRLVVGATVEEQGYDTTVTAGAVLDLLRAAYELLPGVTELSLVETVAGLRPGSPDNAPLLGAVDDGLLVAAGHFRNGVLLAPATATAIVELLVTGHPPEPIAPFSPARFAPEGSRP